MYCSYEYLSESEKIRNELYDLMIEYEIATEDELSLAAGLCGFSQDTMESVLFYKCGFRSIEQLKEELFGYDYDAEDEEEDV